ncbi:MAG: hypothetical protein JW832_12095 [Deltaproteobacteria bacterium]|nr:hypothetical protein [Deltaproteobacteria bacterium]
MRRYKILLSGILLLFLTGTANAAYVTQAILSTSAPTSCDDIPPPVTTFNTKDAAVYFFVTINNVTAGATRQTKWFYEGRFYAENPIGTFSEAGNFCSLSSMEIKDTAAAELTGNWKVAYYYNGDLLIELPFYLEKSSCAALAALSDDAESLTALRAFRDQVLNTTSFGRQLVELFYHYSPALITSMESSPALKEGVRRLFKACAAVSGKFM